MGWSGMGWDEMGGVEWDGKFDICYRAEYF